MGFSIGKFVGAVAKPIGAAVGAATGSTVPGILGAGISAALAPPTRLGLVASPPTSVAPPVQQARLPATRTLGPALGFGAGTTIADLLRRARENTGRSVSSRMIRESVRVCGIETTADTFGLTESEVCQIAIRSGRRRSRGISAADLRRTRSTIRKVSGIQKQLKALSIGRRC